MDFIALDLETADRRNTAPCSIGLVLVQNGAVCKERRILIDPETEFSPYAVAVHGITPEEVAGCPTFPDVWPEIHTLFQRFPVVAHNAAFDLSVIRKAAARYGLPFEPPTVFCTMNIARINYTLPAYSLDAVCHTFGIDPGRHHDALCDARACAMLMLRYLESGCTVVPGMASRHGGNEPYRKPHKKSPRAADLVPRCDVCDTANPLYGCRIVFTGELSMERSEAMQIAVDCGAIVRSSVSNATDILVVGEQELAAVGESGLSTKERKAAELNAAGTAHILIINERTFLSMARNEVPVMNQICMDSFASDADSASIFECFRKIAAGVLRENWLPEDLLTCVLAAKGNARGLYLINSPRLIVRLTEQVKQRYISIPESCIPELGEGVVFRRKKSEPGCILLDIGPDGINAAHLHAVRIAAQITLDAFPCDWGCCGRYLECSDAKQCVHPDKLASLSCYYRRNLLHGRVFYGRNRNI